MDKEEFRKRAEKEVLAGYDLNLKALKHEFVYFYGLMDTFKEYKDILWGVKDSCGHPISDREKELLKKDSINCYYFCDAVFKFVDMTVEDEDGIRKWLCPKCGAIKFFQKIKGD